jgi:DNA-binding NarL/FixJ family response regulator
LKHQTTKHRLPADPKTVRIALVEHLRGVRERWARLIDAMPHFKCVGAFASGEEALRRLPGKKVEVVLMDIRLPRMSGIVCTARLKPLLPGTPILMFTALADSGTVLRALAAGADGYLLKRSRPDEVRAAVLDVLNGGVPLTGEIARHVLASFRRPPAKAATAQTFTPRQEEILTLMAKGFVSKEIAARLGVSYETVRDHLRLIYKKLRVHSRTEAVARFLEARGAENP